MVEVRSFFRRSDGSFVPFGEIDEPVEDCFYVPGAIELSIGGVEVLSLELWDDINWLWPFVVQALDECRQAGRGERFFPDQPLLFSVEALGSSAQVLVSVVGGPIDNRAVGPASEIYAEVGRAALTFFDEFDKVCPPRNPAEDQIVETVRSWFAADA